ncbi:RrF2 family transcriptional regulator [Haloimpatiens lingqiaonensis]|uniref:RrF2 family transcriptional regulator n=1 Tax=Haloimpatiens lingqiaonensis TaxID=1380675 RepID=UPI0010FE142B|nr:Rrf2 family transcriptional regulator [Haloimpatiens lingqiaonensis]
MNITQETDYAIRAVLCLTVAGEGKILEARVISERQSIPMRFLLKLLRKLKSAGIVKSYRGVKGGYSLGRAPENITLKDVIEAVEGPICINRCTYSPQECNANKNGKCAVHHALMGVQKKLIRELEEVNFKKLKEETDMNCYR